MSTTLQIRLAKTKELLMQAYPEGITAPEIAERLGVTRQTSSTDIKRLEDLNTPIEQGEGGIHHYCIDPRKNIQPLTLTLPQAWALYLPLRRMARAQMNRYSLVDGLLRKVTTALDSVINEAIGDALYGSQTDSISDDPFRVLTDAWRDEHQVEIVYKPLSKSADRYLIEPYWFEPAVWSDSTYVIAGLVFDDGSMQPVTLKLERVQSASPRPTPFERLEPQMILDYLSDAWGIWVGDEPQTVRLKFSNQVRQRVLETRWHPTETIEEADDGSIIWSAKVSEPQEMLSWIRGWGADVEVLEPKPIRDEIAIDADRTARLYGYCEDDDKGFLSMRKKK